MTTNPYFNNTQGYGTKGEQDLTEDNVIELIQLAGTDVYYIPRTQRAPDAILNEDPVSTFDTSFPIEMYLNTYTDWGGASTNIIGKVGFELNSMTEWAVSKKRFLEVTASEYPKEGDLLYWPLTQTLWQIDFVDDTIGTTFFQLSKIYTWTIRVSLYTYSYESFSTGIKKVDTEMNPATFVDKFGSNEAIKQEAEEILDFTEENPFGDVIE